MNLFHTIHQIITAELEALVAAGELPEGLPLSRTTVEPPREAAHGDMASNAAMVLAKPAGLAPRALAEKLVPRLLKHAEITSAEIAGPGFINLRLAPDLWRNLVPVILSEGLNYGASSLGAGKKINVEYVSANPTGPMHIGHARGAVFGDALAGLMVKAGYDVTKEYYINDAGSQIDKLARSAFLRYREALGETFAEIPAGLYPGEYLKPVGEGLKAQYGAELREKEEAEWLPLVRRFTIDAMLVLIKKDLADLGVQHNVFTSEKRLQEEGRIEEALALLEGKGLIYRGVLEPPKGKTPEDWEPREQTLFRATQFGDDVDRPVKKSDGSWTYFASDIAYHLDKYRRGFDHMLVELGMDHGGYVKRLKAVVAALSEDKATIEVKLHALVNFLENGEPVKMSKRSGTFTTVRDVLDAVGKDIIRFVMLTRKNDMVLDFDLGKVMEQSRENPVFYVHYAHARAKSVLRMAREECPEAKELTKNITAADLKLLSHEAELALLKRMAEWPRVVEGAALAYEPHRIAFYVQDLAAEFHSLWNCGTKDTTLRFIQKEDIPLTAARLAMVRALSTVVASCLQVLAIEPMEEMR